LLYLVLVQREAGDNQMHQVSAPHSPVVLPLCNNKCQLKKQFSKILNLKCKHLRLKLLVNSNRITKWKHIMHLVKLSYQIVNPRARFLNYVS